jgi:hypothetical protein
MKEVKYKQALKVIFGLICLKLVLGISFYPTFSFSSSHHGINLEDFNHHPTDDGWEKNPFIKPLKEIRLEDLTLQAIIYHPENKAALINNQVLKEGVKIGDVEIIEIKPDHVMVKNNTGLFRLEIKVF